MLEAVEAEQRAKRAETMNTQPSEKATMSVGDSGVENEQDGNTGGEGVAMPALPSK